MAPDGPVSVLRCTGTERWAVSGLTWISKAAPQSPPRCVPAVSGMLSTNLEALCRPVIGQATGHTNLDLLLGAPPPLLR